MKQNEMMRFLIRDQEAVGSNPATPTILSIHKGFTYEYSIFCLKRVFYWSQTVEVCDIFLFCYAVMLSGNALGI